MLGQHTPKFSCLKSISGKILICELTITSLQHCKYKLKRNCFWHGQISIKECKRKVEEEKLKNLFKRTIFWCSIAEKILIWYSGRKYMANIYVQSRFLKINHYLGVVYCRQYWSWLGIEPTTPFQVSYH